MTGGSSECEGEQCNAECDGVLWHGSASHPVATSVVGGADSWGVRTSLRVLRSSRQHRERQGLKSSSNDAIRLVSCIENALSPSKLLERSHWMPKIAPSAT